MGPEDYKRIIEENVKWKELSSGSATGVEPKTKPNKANVDAQYAPNLEEVILRMDNENG
jgi:hypothetical protein